MPRSRLRYLTGVLACALVLALPLPGHAQSPLDPHLGPLSRLVETGQDGPWTVGTEGGWATFRNTSNPGDVRYYWTELTDMADTDFSVAVTLFAQSDEPAPMHAGMIFNYEAADSYFAVSIASDGTPYVIVRNADGFNPQPLDTTSARLDGSDILRLAVEGTNVHATLNGDTLINASFGGPVSRRTGIITYGTGVAGFTGLTVEPIRTASPLPTPGGDNTLPTPGGDDDGPPTPPANDGGDGPPPIPNTGGDGPPPIPNTGGDGPPPIPNTGGDGPPPIPNTGGDGPPPIPNTGGDGPPPLPNTGGDGPPPIPNTGGDGPPPIPNTGGDGPPPIPNTGGDGPPPIPGQQEGGQQTPGTSPIAGLTADQAQRRMGVALGIFLHEMAHAVIGETDLPATGPEEDTADSFSAFAMASVMEGATPQTAEYITGIISSSTLLWYYAAKALEQHQVTHDWQDEHAPDIKRFRNSFCIIYGSEPQVFDPLANKVDFTDRSRQRCAQEYQTKFEAWEELLTLRGRNLGPDLPGRFPANQPGGKINLVFQPTQTEYGRTTEELMKFNDLIPTLLRVFEQYFVWPRDLTVTFRECEEINAWYNPNDSSVTMCYSAIEFYETFLARGLVSGN
ncbi:DUF4344 domain-containing metallopeptidase [Roseovarius sp.]|uniref:DUF4344 domain-containing metallopeptidase n=1 Tax=Roseovarius sp. TaxID=1486281 RepID=UPI003D0DBD15